MERVEAGGGLFGGGLEKVTLTVPEGRPGTEIVLGIDVEVTRQIKLSPAVIRLRCVEHARVRQGDHYEDQDFVVLEHRYPVQMPEVAAAPFGTRVIVQVPDGAAPAMRRALRNEIILEVVMPWRPTLAVQAPLEVLPPAVPRELEPAPSPLDADVEVWSTLARARYRPGETVSGELKIMPMSKAQHAKAAVVRLSALAHNWGEDNHCVVAQVELAKGPFKEDTSIPFSLALPADAPLTYRGKKLDIDWYVDAELLDTPGVTPRAHTPFVVE